MWTPGVLAASCYSSNGHFPVLVAVHLGQWMGKKMKIILQTSRYEKIFFFCLVVFFFFLFCFSTFGSFAFCYIIVNMVGYKHDMQATGMTCNEQVTNH